MSKLLVVDKSVFHALYQCDDKLCAFFKKYNVVLPYALAAECLISENQDLSKNPEKLLRGLDKAIKAGANIGYSSFKLFQLEKTTLCPVKSVVDESSTQQFRDGDPNTDIDFLKQEAECCRKAFEPTIKVLLGIAEKLYANPCKYSELANKSFKDNDRTYRFKNWIKFADQQTEYLLKKELSEEISSLADANWFTWQISRLWLAYCRDWSWKKSRDNSIEKIRSNDLYDIEHITYLSRADGLLTNDQKLQIPLTKAAFPRKDLFVVDTRVNDSRKVQHVFDDIVSKIPANYRIE
ncbi:MAG TPA: hypothetical protein ENH94_05430 [Phycisphaerales bacterium]|nr:hypothetical protein [Phycisphaerales bacterium]